MALSVLEPKFPNCLAEASRLSYHPALPFRDFILSSTSCWNFLMFSLSLLPFLIGSLILKSPVLAVPAVPAVPAAAAGGFAISSAAICPAYKERDDSVPKT